MYTATRIVAPVAVHHTRSVISGLGIGPQLWEGEAPHTGGGARTSVQMLA